MIIDTFYMLFKSNAADVIKGNKAVEKSTQELGDNLKDTGKAAEELGKQYVKVVEGATQALTGLVSFRAIASGLFKSSEINSDLQVQSKLLGQSVNDLKAYSQAVEAAGGSSAAFGEAIQNIFQDISSKGGTLPAIDKVIEKWRAVLKQAGGDTGTQERLFQQLGISDVGLKSLLLESDEEFNKVISAQKDLVSNTEAGANAAREYQKSWTEVKKSVDSVYTSIGSDLFPAITAINGALTNFFNILKDHEHLAEAVFGGAAIGLAALGGALVKGGLVRAGIASAGAVGGLPVLAGAAIIGGGAIAAKAAYDWSSHNGFNANRGAQGAAPLSRNAKDMAFWKSLGYNHYQAAAWIAGEKAESGGDPTARGDGGRGVGLFMWHPDRAAAIKKGTGIDVASAGYDDQLIAAGWDAEMRGDAARIKATTNAMEAAAVHTRYFERPADITGESIRRGQLALKIANDVSFGSSGNVGSSSKSINIKIGDVNIQTSAGDSHSISTGIASELLSQIRTAMANLDDGVAR